MSRRWRPAKGWGAMSIRRIRERAYEILEMGSPGDIAARIINAGLLVLVTLNVAAQIVTPHIPAHLQPYLLWFRWVSVGVYTAEYGLRLWAAGCGQPAGTSLKRLRRLLRPLNVADLAAILSLYLRVWIPVDLRVLRLLRLPPYVYLIRRTLHAPEPPPERPVVEMQLSQVAGELEKARAALLAAEDDDARRIRALVEAVSGEILGAQRLWVLGRRRDGAGDAGDAEKRLADRLEEFATALVEPAHVDSLADLHRAAYERAARPFAALESPSTATQDLAWKGRVACWPVPLAQIGESHFHDLAALQGPAFEQFRRTYLAGLGAGSESILAAMRNATSLAVGPAVAGDRAASVSGQVQQSLNRALNRSRELEEISRASWEAARWELESELEDRLARVVIDTGRYGRLEYSLGRAARWAGLTSTRIVVAARRAVSWAIPEARRWLEGQYEAAAKTAVPLLRWLGVARAEAHEVMEALDQANLASLRERDLPADYLAQFSFTPLTEEDLVVGFERELALIDQAIERWEQERYSSFVLCGERGSGKTTLLNVAQRRLFEEGSEVVRGAVAQKITTGSGLVAFLAELLAIDGVSRLEDLSERLLTGPRRVVLLEGCHNLYMRQIGSLEAIRHLLWLVARTNHHVLWGLCLEENARQYLARWLPFADLFHFDIRIGQRQPSELRRLVMQRHNRSGCRLRYSLDSGNERAVKRQVKRWRSPDEPAVQEVLARIYFEELEELCGANVIVAFYYWLRSVKPTEEDTYEVQPLRALNLDLVRGFSLDQALVLTAVLQHDNATAAELAGVLDSDLIMTRLTLEILINKNILEFDVNSGRCRMNPVALGPVVDMLAGRNLLN